MVHELVLDTSQVLFRNQLTRAHILTKERQEHTTIRCTFNQFAECLINLALSCLRNTEVNKHRDGEVAWNTLSGTQRGNLTAIQRNGHTILVDNQMLLQLTGSDIIARFAVAVENL